MEELKQEEKIRIKLVKSILSTIVVSRGSKQIMIRDAELYDWLKPLYNFIMYRGRIIENDYYKIYELLIDSRELLKLLGPNPERSMHYKRLRKLASSS